MDDLDFSTLSIHADEDLARGERSVAPAISVSTTFRYRESDIPLEKDWDPSSPFKDVYARETTPVLTRAERTLAALIGQPTICYGSGIAAITAAFLLVQPSVVAITKGYPGAHGALKILGRTKGKERLRVIDLDDEYPAGETVLCWVETPLNPTGECRDLQYYADKVHAVGGKLGVDATLGPPPLQDPFKWGADVVAHSCTKYFLGHSDALLGSVSVRTKEEWKELWEIRMYTGGVVGSLEAWLLLRSLKTMSLRVPRQAQTATKLAQWLHSLTLPDAEIKGVVAQVWHASLQEGADKLVGKGKQLEDGPACFLIRLATPEAGTKVPLLLHLFAPAASLGGVESLVEQRRQADPTADPCLVRLSVGIEAYDDLKNDLSQALRQFAS